MKRSLIPLGVFLALVVLLGVGLKLDPRKVPSPLVGKAAPEFVLPQLHVPEQTLSPEDLKGEVWLLNVWASWCVSCRAEHAVINVLADRGANVVGLNYKDDPVDAKRWLERLGNPYLASAVDRAGRVGIDWGVYGVPETFVIDRKGTVRYKHIGPLKLEDAEQIVLPLLQQLEGESA